MPHLAQSDTVPASLAMTRATDLLENMAMDGATRVSPHIAEAADCVGVSLNWRKGDAVLRICVPEDWGEVCYAHYSDGTAPAVLMQPLESVLLREWLKTFAPPKTRRELLPNDSIAVGRSVCCGATMHWTNGHHRKDAPGAVSTWWHACSYCGYPCDPAPLHEADGGPEAS